MYTRKIVQAVDLFLMIVLFGPLLAACAPSAATQAPAVSPDLTPTGVIPVSDLVQSKKERLINPAVPASDLAALENGNRAFALDFYQAVRDQDGNLFYSPYSISLALAMTYAGARGTTESQMGETLHFTLPQDRLHAAINALDQELASRADASSDHEGDPFQLNIANSIWAQQDYTFLPQYLDLLAQNYGAGLRLVDFAGAAESARQTINDWVNQQTQGKIKDLIPQGAIDQMTRLVLANAIYFKASWLHPFEENLTQDGDFHLLDGGHVRVPMMAASSSTHLPYVQGQGYQAVELPYVGQDVSMLILVPDAGTFQQFEAALDPAKLQDILTGLKPQQVAFKMPKFKFETSYGLSNTLAGMGMPDAFNPGQADFSGMDGGRNLYITKVLHKAYVAVDENGTEAAAATAVIVGLTAMQPSPVELTVDRPFIFLIQDKPTGTILFMGRILNPAE
jgi:serpin B